jgi:5-hydroxyisourate hydrolase
MSAITTHVLDLSRGVPAAGITVLLEISVPPIGWRVLAERVTDQGGRVQDFIAEGSRLDVSRYRLSFATAAYFANHGVVSFHPQVAIEFDVRDAKQHYHVPLLLSPFGYSTYRGS